MYSSLLIDEFHTDKNTKAVEHGLKVTREYVNDKGPQYSLAVGDTVTVNITLGGLGADEYYGVIEDELPSGLIPINQSFKNEDTNSRYYNYGVWDREITENGMVLSLYKVPAGEKSYTYKARVISEGKFNTPPATASLMYAPEVYGRSDAQVIEITKESKIIPSKVVQEKIAGASKSKVVAGLIIIFLAIVFSFILRRRGVTRGQVKEKIKNILNKFRRNPPIPPLQNHKGVDEGPVNKNSNQNDQ